MVSVQSSLNIRARPHQNATVIGHFDNGAVIEVIEIEYGWAKVPIQNGAGYVSAKYLKLVERAPEIVVEEVVEEETKLKYEHIKFSFGLEKLYYGTFLESIALWISDNILWSILILLAGGIGFFFLGFFFGNLFDNEWIKALCLLPTKWAIYGASIMIGLCLDWFLRMTGFLDIMGWILGAMIGDNDLSFFSILLILVSDWLPLAALLGTYGGGLILVGKELEVSYAQNLLLNLLSFPIVLICLGIHNILFVGEYIITPGSNQIVLYAIVFLVWLISLFIPPDFGE